MVEISVIMSVYNGSDFICDSINSILNQTFSDFEFVIVDDGSTDNTKHVIKSIKDNRIKLIVNDSNLGLPKSLNKAINQSEGRYIARQDADDISDRYRLEKQFKYAENTNADLVGSDSVNIDINGNFLSISSCNEFDNLDLRNVFFHRKMLFAHGTAFLRRESLLDIGLYNEEFFYAQDAELWLRFIYNGKIVRYIHEPLYFLRRLPLKNDKKIIGQKVYMDYLKQYYYKKEGYQNISNLEHEIGHINQFLNARAVKIFKNYMGEYWHYCSTMSLIGSNNRKKAYKYIIKAFKERNDIRLFLSHLKVLTFVFLPQHLTKRMLKRQ